jgi:hypothetical protein
VGAEVISPAVVVAVTVNGLFEAAFSFASFASMLNVYSVEGVKPDTITDF